MRRVQPFLVCVFAGISSTCSTSSSGDRVVAPATSELTLAPLPADVWAFRLSVHGVAPAESALAECVVDVGTESIRVAARGDAFSGEIPLAPGENVARARCVTAGGRRLVSPSARYLVRLSDAPKARARALVSAGRLVLDATGSEPNQHFRAPLSRYEWTRVDGPAGRERTVSVGSGATLELPETATDGTFSYRVRVTDARGASDEAETRVTAESGTPKPRAPEDGPTWLGDAVVYGVVPPLYGGRPLAAVRDALGSLEELGVTTLWLSPVFETIPGDFGYAVTDYHEVRPDYGTESDLLALVRDAHRENLRVLLDFVPNHTSSEHPYFVDAERHREASHYFGFHERNGRGDATHYFDWELLPNLEYGNPEVARWMSEVATHWIRDLGIDGYRVDAAWALRERHPQFLEAWTEEVRRVAPGSMLLAEASAEDPFYLAHGFDAAYDWTGTTGHWAWDGVFDSKHGIATRLDRVLTEAGRKVERPDRVFRFLNNNDTGERFYARHGEGLTRVATAALLTLPGIPCLYSFDEVGGRFEPYGERAPLAPPRRDALRAWHKDWIHLRRTLPALRGRGFVPLFVGDPRKSPRAPEVYAFERRGPSASDVAVVALNFDDRPAAARIVLSHAGGGPRRYRDARDGTRVTATRGALAVHLPPFGARVFVPE
jgi:glycosidase